MTGVQYFDFPGVSGAPRCGITLAESGAMKPKRDDANRSRFFRSSGIDPESVVSLSQIHSRIVRVADTPTPFRGYPEGDGVITRNRDLVPCVTVADCMPIFVFDSESGCFGVLHSGWRGTGIVRSALELAADEWGARPEDFSVILGPHIRSCCYTVDGDRADHFSKTYGPSCRERGYRASRVRQRVAVPSFALRGKPFALPFARNPRRPHPRRRFLYVLRILVWLEPA